MNEQVLPAGPSTSSGSPGEILCQAIDAALAKREIEGKDPPDAVACGPKVAAAWTSATYTRKIKIRALPMMGTDAALLLSRNRILDIVSVAQPDERG